MTYEEEKQEFFEIDSRYCEIIDPLINQAINSLERRIMGLDEVVEIEND